MGLKLIWDSDCLISFLDARDNHPEELDPGFQPVPSVQAFRLDRSRLDGFAVLIDQETAGLDRHLAQILKGDKNLGDRDQLLSAWLSQVNMFVSADNGFQKKRAALEAAVGFQICRPPEAVEQASKGASDVSAETSETGER